MACCVCSYCRLVNRGTNNSLFFSCFNSATEEAAASRLQLVLGNASDTAPGIIWANAEIVAEQCYSNRSRPGELIGTSFTARDMMRIVDALKEDGLLRYWGEHRQQTNDRVTDR